MKKYLFIAAAAAMFAACSNEDVLVDEGGSTSKDLAIAFGTFTEKATRAGETSENSGIGDFQGLSYYHNNFRVWGYKNVADNYSPVFDGTDDKSLVQYSSSAWSYTPVRYWDKGATNYNFFAATPQDAGWTATYTSSTGIVTFAKTGATVDGKSLAQAADVTGQPNDVFGSNTTLSGTDNKDLMIANDVLNYTNYTGTEEVTFYFNHILSRLNIAVKHSLPTTTTVKLYALQVVNMNKQGDFDEAATLGEGVVLKDGTAGRWNNQSTAYTFGPTFNTSDDAIETNPYWSGTPTNVITTSYNYFYQGLVIPQTVGYESINLNGSSTETKPYLYIKYSIDGEYFEAYYNLASTFINANANYVHPLFGAAYKLDGGDFAFEKSATEWYTSGGTLGTGDAPSWLDGDDSAEGVQKVPVKYSELADRGVCDFTFCEGWQNNLKLEIKPDAIYFDANVFAWKEKLTKMIDVK
ncbi:MAG: hypothetical protein Q4A08_07530 [Bacteroidales bacterium]|nr:hypothetical protein [Bacteroidales bacterium]